MIVLSSSQSVTGFSMRVGLRLWQRLFVAFAALSIGALATFASLQQEDLRRGFLDYLNRLSLERLHDGAARLGARYEAEGNWGFVRDRPDELLRILGLPPPPPPRDRPDGGGGGGGIIVAMQDGSDASRNAPPQDGSGPPSGAWPPPGQRPPPGARPPPGMGPFPPRDANGRPMPRPRDANGRPLPPPGDAQGRAWPPPRDAQGPPFGPPGDAQGRPSSTESAPASGSATATSRDVATNPDPAPAPAANGATPSTHDAASGSPPSTDASVPAPRNEPPPPPMARAMPVAPPPPPRPAGPLDLGARVLLVDAQGQPIAGNPDVPADAPSVPVLAHGAEVGRLLLAPMPALRGGLDVTFAQTQLHHAFGMAFGVLLGALLLSWLLARWLLEPVRALGKGAQALVAGNFAARVPATRSDELGALAQDFNLLAATLERHRDARRQWGADIAHELRTPIAILRGEIQALQDGIRQPGPETLASLQAECDRLAGLVDDLYQLALADAGALVYRLEVLDLHELLREVERAHAGAMRDAGLDFAIDAPAKGALPVRVDAQRLMQLFGNLLRNSMRYTSVPGRVRIGVRRVGNDVFVDVEDSAPGVPDEALPHLFDRLYRVDPSRSRRSGGAGLGLAICRTIAQAHGGQIVASASPMGGVCITLRLPVASIGA